MARQQPGETKTPVIVALVVSVLATLTLGVLYYMATDQIAALKEEAKKAGADKTAAEKAASTEKEKNLVYKAAIGFATQEEVDQLKNSRFEPDAKAAHAALMSAVRGQVEAAVKREARNFVGVKDELRVTPDDAVQWAWPEGGKLEGGPKKTLVDGLVGSYARAQLATAAARREVDAATTDKQKAAEALARAEDARLAFDKAAKDFPAQVAAKAKELSDKLDAELASVKKFTLDTNRQVATLNEEKSKAELARGEQADRAEQYKKQADRALQEQADRQDPFSGDRPHGKVLSRRGNEVTINLGSADNVRPGLTFSVQPSDVPTRGLQTRMRTRIGPDGRPVSRNGQPVMDVVPKATIEVVNVVAPNLSEARITSNPDPIREGVLAGDVLYNAAWRRGSVEHVALIGVFDTNGDGIDDVKQVMKDLTRMGVAVDAYFDLEQKKWVGDVSRQTTYAVEGAFPISGSGDALAAAKATLDQALRDATESAKAKGVQVVKARTFFSRIGYNARLDVSPDAINRAFNRYLQNSPVATPEPTEGK